MKLPGRNHALRQALELPMVGGDDHSEAVRNLKGRHPHTIARSNEYSAGQCSGYALGLDNDSEYRAVAMCRDIHANSEFMDWLIPKLAPLDGPTEGDLVLYFAGEQWKHAGIYTQPGRVKSKWGAKPIYDHEFSEVPYSYGDCVKFYTRPAQSQAVVFFKKFVLERHRITQSDIDDLRR